MPAGGFKVFVDGQVLPAADINAYLMQGILVFDSEASRDAAIAGPDHGMFAFTTDSDQLWVYDGADWKQYMGNAPAEVSNTPTGTYTAGGVDYAYFEFTSSGTLTVTRGGFADVLVVAGGGSGGVDNNAVETGGGGGAGGLLQLTEFYLAAGSYTCTVGAGGAAKSGAGNGNSGSNSSFGTLLTAMGGGYGGGSGQAGGFGGSGGGGGDLFSPDSIGVPGQGNAGKGNQGGGGGAGAAATNASGGAGITSSITGTAVTYATGGGANTGTTTGAANTGNGGKGVISGTSGAGGSGVVIVRVRV